MAQQDMIEFWRIVDMVREFCTQRRTGTVFIVSDDNRLAQVHLESGNIVSLLCRGRHGQEALAGMRTMQAGRLRFDANYLSTGSTERFDTNAVLDLLGGGREPQARRGPPVMELAPPPAPPEPAGGMAVHAAALEALLVQYIGPMGEIVCAEHMAKAGNLKALVAMLADEIPDKHQAAHFAREAGRMLGIA